MWARQLDCSVTEMDVVVCSLGKLSARSTWIHAVQETKAKWMNINLHRSRLLYGFVDCFNLSTTSALEKHTSQKLCHFWHCCWDSEAILSKNVSSRSPGLNCSYRKNFHHHYRDLGRKVRDFGNRGSPASHLKKFNFFFPRRKERRYETSEIEPVQSTGLTWRGPLLRTPVGFIAQLVEHRTGIRGGHGFEFRCSFQLLKLENLLRWSLSTFIYNRSTNMNYFI